MNKIKVRSIWNEEEENWYFSIVDVIEILIGTDRPRKYWSDMKSKLTKSGTIAGNTRKQIEEKTGKKIVAVSLQKKC